MAREMLTGLALPFRGRDQDLIVPTSIGSALFSGVGESTQAVMQRAGQAFAAARSTGGGRIRTG